MNEVFNLTEAYVDEKLLLSSKYRKFRAKFDGKRYIIDCISHVKQFFCRIYLPTYTYPREIKTPDGDANNNFLLKNLSRKALFYLIYLFNGCLSYFPKARKCHSHSKAQQISLKPFELPSY
jgi:hypothetical protein